MKARQNPLAKLRRELDSLSAIQLVVVVVVFAVFMVMPLLVVTYSAFFFEGSLSAHWFTQIFQDPFYLPISAGFTSGFPFVKVEYRYTGQLIQQVADTLFISGPDFGVIPNSLLVAILTTLLSTIVGTTLALVMARYKFPGKDIFRLLILIPLLSTPFIGAIGILRMISSGGSLNLLLYETLHILPFRVVVDGLAAVIIVQALHFYALVYLTAYSAFVNIDPTLEEQAENMGATGVKLLRTVTLPLALPGIEAGAILTFILSIEDLGTPIVFQQSLARKTIVYQIYTRIFAPTGEINPIAPALSVILLSIALLGFLVIRKYVSLKSYAMLSKGGTWQPRARATGTVQTILVYAFLLGLLFFALLPHVGVFLLSFAQIWGNTILPSVYTLENYGILIGKAAVEQSIGNSLIYSGIATILIISLATGAAYIISRKSIPGREALDSLVTLPIAVPGIVIALGYFTLFLKTPISPIINPVPLLIVSYMIRKFPFTVRAAFAGLQQTHVALEEASLNLGAGRYTTFRRIVIPLIAVNVLAGGMLSFVYSMSEVSTSLILGGVNPRYAPVTWKIVDVLFQVGAGPFQAAVLGVFLMVAQIVVIIIATAVLKQRTASLAGI